MFNTRSITLSRASSNLEPQQTIPQVVEEVFTIQPEQES